MIKCIELSQETYAPYAVQEGGVLHVNVPVDRGRRIWIMGSEGLMDHHVVVCDTIALPLAHHPQHIEVVLRRAMEQAGMSPKEWDGVAVSYPDGLSGFFAVQRARCQPSLSEDNLWAYEPKYPEVLLKARNELRAWQDAQS